MRQELLKTDFVGIMGILAKLEGNLDIRKILFTANRLFLTYEKKNEN